MKALNQRGCVSCLMRQGPVIIWAREIAWGQVAAAGNCSRSPFEVVRQHRRHEFGFAGGQKKGPDLLGPFSLMGRLQASIAAAEGKRGIPSVRPENMRDRLEMSFVWQTPDFISDNRHIPRTAPKNWG